MNKKAILLLTVLLFSFIPLVSSDTEWFNSSFQYRNVYAIDSSLIDEELYDFPVLVYLNSSYVSWDRVNDNLSDLRFYNVSNNLLSHELQNDYVLNDEAWLWVKIPYINNVSDTYFFMYYGCFYAESVENKTDVWSNGYVMVHHMNNYNSTIILDSTSNDNDGTKKGANEPIEATEKIGKGQDFNVTNLEDITVTHSASLDSIGATNFTFMAWIKINHTTDDYTILGKRQTGNYWQWRVSVNRMRLYLYDGALDIFPASTAGAGDGNWHFVSVTRSGSDITFFYDGSPDGTASSAKDGSSVNDVKIGASYIYSPFDGLIDEVRISSVARSAAWVGASYETQNLNLISLENTDFYNTEYLAFSIIAIVIALFCFVMVITIKEKRK